MCANKNACCKNTMNENLFIKDSDKIIQNGIIKAIKNTKIAMMTDEDAKNLAERIWNDLKRYSHDNDAVDSTQDSENAIAKKIENTLHPKTFKNPVPIEKIPQKYVKALESRWNLIEFTEEANANPNNAEKNLKHDVKDDWLWISKFMTKYRLSPALVADILSSDTSEVDLDESLNIVATDSEIARIIADAIRTAMSKNEISEFLRLSDTELFNLVQNVGNFLVRSSHIDKNRANESFLSEAAGLSRLNKYLDEYDCACISADKYLPARDEFKSQKEYEDEFISRLGKQKKLDSKALQVELRSKFGGVINIQGFYRYGTSKNASKEKSYLVVNRGLSEKEFKNELLELACDAKQNSFFFSPKGTRSGYWIYTGIDLSEPDEKDTVHAKGDEEFVGTIHLGKIKKDSESTSYSLINDRPFVATDSKDALSSVVIEEAVEDSLFSKNIHRNEGEYANKVKKFIKDKNKSGYTVSDDVGNIKFGLNSFNSSFGENCVGFGEEYSSKDAIFILNRMNEGWYEDDLKKKIKEGDPQLESGNTYAFGKAFRVLYPEEAENLGFTSRESQNRYKNWIDWDEDSKTYTFRHSDGTKDFFDTKMNFVGRKEY